MFLEYRQQIVKQVSRNTEVTFQSACRSHMLLFISADTKPLWFFGRRYFRLITAHYFRLSTDTINIIYNSISSASAFSVGPPALVVSTDNWEEAAAGDATAELDPESVQMAPSIYRYFM